MRCDCVEVGWTVLALVSQDACGRLLHSEIWSTVVDVREAAQAMAYQVANQVALRMTETTSPLDLCRELCRRKLLLSKQLFLPQGDLVMIWCRTDPDVNLTRRNFVELLLCL